MSNRNNINKFESYNPFEAKKPSEKMSIKKKAAALAILLTFAAGGGAGFIGNEALDTLDAKKLVPSDQKAVHQMINGEDIYTDVATLVDTDVDNDGDSDVDIRQVGYDIMNDPANEEALKDGVVDVGENITYSEKYVEKKDNL